MTVSTEAKVCSNYMIGSIRALLCADYYDVDIVCVLILNSIYDRYNIKCPNLKEYISMIQNEYSL